MPVGLEGSLIRRFLMLAGLMLVLQPGLVEAKQSLVRAPYKVADSCAAGCRAAHNRCRINKRGSRSCDRQLQRCLRGCLRRR